MVIWLERGVLAMISVVLMVPMTVFVVVILAEILFGTASLALLIVWNSQTANGYGP